jgi:hypothetical protein
MNHLPSRIVLLLINIHPEIIVDASDERSKNDDHHEEVEDTHVVPGRIVHVSEEEGIPPVRPCHIRLFPLYFVGVNDVKSSARVVFVGLKI